MLCLHLRIPGLEKAAATDKGCRQALLCLPRLLVLLSAACHCCCRCAPTMHWCGLQLMQSKGSEICLPCLSRQRRALRQLLQARFGFPCSGWLAWSGHAKLEAFGLLLVFGVSFPFLLRLVFLEAVALLAAWPPWRGLQRPSRQEIFGHLLSCAKRALQDPCCFSRLFGLL